MEKKFNNASKQKEKNLENQRDFWSTKIEWAIS